MSEKRPQISHTMALAAMREIPHLKNKPLTRSPEGRYLAKVIVSKPIFNKHKELDTEFVSVEFERKEGGWLLLNTVIPNRVIGKRYPQ